MNPTMRMPLGTLVIVTALAGALVPLAAADSYGVPPDRCWFYPERQPDGATYWTLAGRYDGYGTTKTYALHRTRTVHVPEVAHDGSSDTARLELKANPDTPTLDASFAAPWLMELYFFAYWTSEEHLGTPTATSDVRLAFKATVRAAGRDLATSETSVPVESGILGDDAVDPRPLYAPSWESVNRAFFRFDAPSAAATLDQISTVVEMRIEEPEIVGNAGTLHVWLHLVPEDPAQDGTRGSQLILPGDCSKAAHATGASPEGQRPEAGGDRADQSAIANPFALGSGAVTAGLGIAGLTYFRPRRP